MGTLPGILWRWSLWGLRFALIAFTVSAFEPPPPPTVPLPQQQTVQTNHPILCVHTRLTDEVEAAKIQRSLEMVREMGATTIVEFFPWAYREPVRGRYDWTHSDLVIDHARAQGLTIIARLGMVPDWARPADTSLNYLTPAAYDEFADYVEAFTARYQDDIDHVIIWNEPNLALEWGYQEIDPATYVDLLSHATPAARRGNPDVVVLAGALAPTLEPPGSESGLDDLLYLEALYEAGFSEWYDALAIHTYGLKFPPESEPAPDVINFRRAELLREMMVAYGDGDKPVTITEMGWNDHPRWTKAVRPGQRIVYTIDAFEHAEAEWPWVENMCLWVLRYPAPTYSWPDYYTLIAPDFTPKPIYEELQAWARD